MSPRRRAPQGGKCADTTWRHERAVKAGKAAAAAAHQRAVLRASRSRSKAAAWSNGYRAGYVRAAAFYRSRLRRFEAGCPCLAAVLKLETDAENAR